MRDSGIARNIFEGLSIVKVVHAKILSDHIPLITIACAMTLDLDVKIRFFFVLFCFVFFTAISAENLPKNVLWHSMKASLSNPNEKLLDTEARVPVWLT